MSDIFDLSSSTYGNIIVCYVWWIIQKANDMGLKTLYFLARDGFILRETAEIICKKLNSDIDCKYLYCSRQSLRIPTFHLIGDEMYDYIFASSEKVTANIVMNRTGLSKSEISEIYNSIGYESANADNSLSRQELEEFSISLKNSELFSELVKKSSRKAYETASGYLKQEGLLEQEKVCIVDSGWSGSMQKSLQILLGSLGFSGSVIGFYFGLYNYPAERKYGDYLSFYFSVDSNIWHKIKFSNSLFECMLSAPHGMTIGYSFENGIYKPILNEYNISQDTLIKTQIRAIRELAERINYYELAKMDHQKLIKNCKKHVIKIMVKPSRENALILGRFQFCDDCSDTYRSALAAEEQLELISNYLMIPRIFRKLTGKKYKHSGLFWPYGVIAFLPKHKQWWYRLNVFAWEFKRLINIKQ